MKTAIQTFQPTVLKQPLDVRANRGKDITKAICIYITFMSIHISFAWKYDPCESLPNLQTKGQHWLRGGTEVHYI